MRDACTFTFVVPVYDLEQQSEARCFAEMFPNVRVEAILCVPPRGSLARRAAGRLFRTLFAPLRADTPDENPAEATPYYPFNSLNHDFVAAVERCFAQGCDIFQAEFADMLTLGPLMAGRVPSIFVHHQLHFVYAKRFLETNGVSGANVSYVTQRMIREEAAYLDAFDAAIVFSEVDREALTEFCPTLEISVSPFPSPEDPVLPAAPFDQAVNRFVFVASEAHRPNYDGLRWFMKEVWPEIKRLLPGASVEVIGKWSRPAQASLPNSEDICFSGFVPELLKSLQKKIMLVPVWIGSGIRTKILAAWSASCPVVSTTVGVEGLPGKSGEHFIVADTAPAFASACLELSQNISQLNRIAVNGLELVQKHYSLQAVRKTRLAVYEKLLGTQQKAK
jgi:glycosyltransferase involved in cell wall biosynthesis